MTMFGPMIIAELEKIVLPIVIAEVQKLLPELLDKAKEEVLAEVNKLFIPKAE